MSDEVPLTGGFVGEVVRVGDTVHRLRDLGVVEGIAAAYEWTARHRDVLGR